MEKGFLVSRLIYSIIITLTLFHFYNVTPNGKLILIPFLICSTSVLIKNICLLMNKEKYVEFFNKIFTVGFLLFWFGFLIYWCYKSLIDKDYSLLLFSIPFWISGVYIIKRILLKH